MPMVAMARAMAAAMGTPSTPHRVESDPSATTMTFAVLGCSNSRTMSGLKFVSEDCGHPIDDVFDDRVNRQPVARGMRAEPDAVRQDVLRQVLDVLRIHFRAPPHE